MKKIIILFLLLFIVIIAKAQTKQPLTLKEIQNAVQKDAISEKQMGFNLLKSLTWICDTIVTFDENNVFKQLYASSINPITSELIVTIKQWDGANWNNYNKTIYSYNPIYLSYTETYQEWNGVFWLNDRKNTYTYDQSGNLLCKLFQSWSASQWHNYLRVTDTYDASNNLIKVFWEGFVNDTLNQAENDFYTYDANGNNLTLFRQATQNGVWGDWDSTYMTYDNNGKLLSKINKVNDSGVFVNTSKDVYLYDANGRKISDTSYMWDIELWFGSTVTWFAMNCNSYTYDNNGNLLTQLGYERYTWDYPDTLFWVYEIQMTAIYDANNNLLSEQTRYFDFIGSYEWYDYRYQYTYDGNNYSITGKTEGDFGGGWEPEQITYKVLHNLDVIYNVEHCYRYEASYKQVNPCSAYFTLTADTTTPHHYYAINMAAGLPPLSYVWSWGDGNFDSIALPSHVYDSAGFYNICLTIIDNAGCTSTYCDTSYLAKTANTIITVDVIAPVGVQENNIKHKVSIFPNPATTKLNVEGVTGAIADVYDISGKLLLSKQLNTNQLDISTLAKGLYFIKLSTAEGSLVRKFVKE